jgi:hypothetical protein
MGGGKTGFGLSREKTQGVTTGGLLGLCICPFNEAECNYCMVRSSRAGATCKHFSISFCLVQGLIQSICLISLSWVKTKNTWAIKQASPRKHCNQDQPGGLGQLSSVLGLPEAALDFLLPFSSEDKKSSAWLEAGPGLPACPWALCTHCYGSYHGSKALHPFLSTHVNTCWALCMEGSNTDTQTQMHTDTPEWHKWCDVTILCSSSHIFKGDYATQ